MSGIVGVVRLDGGPIEPADLDAMRRALAHRADGDVRLHARGSVALGGTVCPALADDGDMLAFHGRIANRAELAGALEAPCGSDPELAFAAFRRWRRDA